MAFQELYLSMDPISSEVDMPLHRTVQQWIRSTVAYEGGNLQMGLDLYRVFEDAGLVDIRVRAAADVQTPMQPSNLATVVAAILPRILASGVTTEAEVDIETLQQRLDVERDRANATSISELKFAAFARNGAS